MARPKKTITPKDSEQENFDSDMDDIMDKLDALNPDISDLSDEALSNVDTWIDTGCYALNAICSGSVFKGIPNGRITGFTGPSGCGKTLIMNRIMANGLKNFSRALYFDSENALDRNTAMRLGCDVNRIKHIPIEAIEDCKNQSTVLLTQLIEKDMKSKVMIFIDSLGQMVSKKELEDSIKGNPASDMGARAKALKSLLRVATGRSMKAQVPIIFSNHIVENPAQLHPTMVKNQSGGHGPTYIASLLVQLSASNERIEADSDKIEHSSLSTKVSGINLRCLTVKNRFIPAFIETTLYLNYRTGLSKYRGLLDLAVLCGTIQTTGTIYTVDGKSVGRRSTIDDNPEFWENGPLQKLDQTLQKELVYSNETTKEIENQLKEEVKETLNVNVE